MIDNQNVKCPEESSDQREQIACLYAEASVYAQEIKTEDSKCRSDKVV